MAEPGDAPAPLGNDLARPAIASGRCNVASRHALRRQSHPPVVVACMLLLHDGFRLGWARGPSGDCHTGFVAYRGIATLPGGDFADHGDGLPRRSQPARVPVHHRPSERRTVTIDPHRFGKDQPRSLFSG